MNTAGAAVVLTSGMVFNGRYQIVRVIASGGMGSVYEAIHLDTQRRRALKVMLPQLVSNDGLRQRFKQEATVVSKVQSQHVVEITDAGVDPNTGAPFIVMEFLAGADMQELLKQHGPMPPQRLAELIRQAALALDRTHAHGIVHRDLKPENLFVTQRDDGSPHLKVVDFGIAKVVADGLRSTNQTATIGTPAYMAPEQIQSKANIGPATDVYALAQVAYTMLVGEGYFAEEQEASENSFQLISAVAQGTLEPMASRAKRRRNVDVPPSIDAWFRHATARDPKDRFPTAGALASAFMDAVAIPSDGRRSFPDAAKVANMSTGDFLSHSQPQITPAGLPAYAGGNATEVAGPLPEIGSARTISATVGEAPRTPKKKGSGALVFAALGVLALGGVGAFVVLSGKDDPKKPKPASDDDDDKPAASKSGAASASGAAVGADLSCPDGMVKVARATFTMGNGKGDASPAHKVTIGPYCIDRTEVSVAAYKECVAANKCEPREKTGATDPAERDRNDPHCNFSSTKLNHPINCVDWADANSYCTWAGKRLPSEPEWELAARGGDERELPWGGDAPSGKLLNACDLECKQTFGKGGEWSTLFPMTDSFATTAPVAHFTGDASPAGVLNMAGNVREWTNDWFDLYGGSVKTIEDPKPTEKPVDNPRKVARGGSFMSFSEEHISVSSRWPMPETTRSASIGFRCAKK